MLRIDWNDYHQMVGALSDAILTMYPGDEKIHLVGLPRGGTLIALHLTYLNERFYAHFDAFNTKRELDGEHTVVVDDVLDTGKTRIKLMNELGLSSISTFAVLVDKASCWNVPPAQISVMPLRTKLWVAFPYEREQDQKEIKSREERGYDEI